MSSKAEVYRERAAECERMAETATDQQTRKTYLNLAKTWLNLAAQLEDRAASQTVRHGTPPDPKE